jgi:aminopeptidase N
MRTETPVPVKLADYAPYPFEVERVHLTFTLDPDATRVDAVMEVTRKTPGGSDPLVLDGEALKLLTVAVDDRELAPSDYAVSESGLTIAAVPDRFTLKTQVEIAPSKNTALSGLYMSGGRFCTQCESVGFRRITFYPDRPDVMSKFFVSMNADKAAYPILLSNGTPGEAGDLDGDDAGRHYATWDDPHRKPSYLFALCAGDYDIYSDTFTTMSGKTIDLAIHVDKGDADRAAWAMDSLKRSMTWDEEAYGREYDLGVFNIVAVRDFNFGAMENKGLNIFNSAYVLADEATATDADFEAIESIVAHEYFHNWTGNRVTCRDWFQLCLKEGLTVFRDQSFSADMRSASVQRIKDVIRLRARQFAEDAGPLAHSVRPDNYGSIDNLYTATVYEKGAEIIGMLKRLIGPEDYRKGMDLYFERHDGQAVTIEDFYACFSQVTGRDFKPFLLWYAQAGTPVILVNEDWDAANSRLTVTFTQKIPETPGQFHKRPMPIPLSGALLSQYGGYARSQEAGPDEWMIVLADRQETHTFSVASGATRPFLSLNRGFSAPVRLEREIDMATQIALVSVETDPFNQWDGLQSLLKTEILALAAKDHETPDAALLAAQAEAVVSASKTDPAFAALLTRLPDIGELMLDRQPADPVALGKARKAVKAALYGTLSGHVNKVLNAPSPEPFNPGAEQAGIRALRTAMIDLQAASPHQDAPHTLYELFQKAPNMTEQLACLRALAGLKGGPRKAALEDFEAQWKDNPLVMDKWFAAQAGSGDAATVSQLIEHAAFDMSNPNRVRSVAAVFGMQNLSEFHVPSGAGYKLLEDIALKADAVNPALAARLLMAFEQWRVLGPEAQAAATAALERLTAADLSENAADIVGRALG